MCECLRVSCRGVQTGTEEGDDNALLSDKFISFDGSKSAENMIIKCCAFGDMKYSRGEKEGKRKKR